MSKQEGSCNAENETDDVFEEIHGHKIKSEIVQVQNDNVEILHEISEEKLESSSFNLNEPCVKFCKVSKGNDSSYAVKCPVIDLGYNLCNVNKKLCQKDVETGRCLKHEDPDDVFDEEQEKGEMETVKYVVRSENIVTEIKIEIDEDNCMNDTEENLEFLANAVKQENDTDGNFDNSQIEKVSPNEAVSVDGEHSMEVKMENESERLRKEMNDLKKILWSQMGKNGTANKQVENEKNLTNQGITNIDSNSQSNQSNVESRRKPQQKNEINKNIISSEQNSEKEVHANAIIESTETGENVAVENLNRAVNNKGPSDRNNERGENVNKSVKLTGIENIGEANKNISRKNHWNLTKNSSEIDANIKMSNTGSLSRPITDKKKKSIRVIKQKGLLNKNNSKFKKKIVGKAKYQNRKLPLSNVSANEKSKTVQGNSDIAIPVIGSKENCEDTVTENKQKTQTETDQIETSSLSKFCNKSVNKSCQTQTETIEVCAKNSENTQIEEHNGPQNMHVDYICPKCPFKAKRKAVLKRHLLKHGIEFSSTITSFFDIIKKAKLYTSQLERIYDEKEAQTKDINRNNQSENERCEEATNENNDVQFEKEGFGNIVNNTLQIQNVEICTNASSRMSTRSNSYTLVNEDRVSNTGNENMSQSKETSVIGGKEIIVEKSTENNNVPIQRNCLSESEQSVKYDEIGTVTSKSNLSNNIEYSCTRCLFKTKRRALLKTHLLTHVEKLASGIITFLDLVKNGKEPSNQFRRDSQHKEEQTQNITGNTDADDKIDIFNVAIQNIDSDAQSKCENKLENEEESCKIVENGNVSIEVVDDTFHNGDCGNDHEDTVPIVVNEAKEEGTVPLNENTTSVNVDNKSEIRENKVNESECIEVPSTDEAKPEIRTKRKRKRAVRGTSLSKKKIKLQVGDEKPYRCAECSYRTDKKKNFNEHKTIHSKDVIKCSQCEFMTNIKRNLANHMLVHLKPEEIKLHKCPQCPYQTKRTNDLRIHMVRHKKPEELKIFQCDKCPYQSIRKGNLKSHQSYHKPADEVTLYNCAECAFKTREKSSLRKHMVRHQKEEDIFWYNCEKCSFATKHKSGLRKHAIVHKSRDEIKTYDCPECPYKAKHKCHLNSHMVIHKDPNEIQMHECVQCSYKSIRKTNLLAHMMLQHKKQEEIKMAKCEHCPYETKLKSNLLKHVKRRHNLSAVKLLI